MTQPMLMALNYLGRSGRLRQLGFWHGIGREGLRHNATLALAGMLLRSGWSEESVEQFVLAICFAAHDEEVDLRLQDIRSTGERIEDDEPATGAPTLAGIFDEVIVAKVREWLQLRSDCDAGNHSLRPAPHRFGQCSPLGGNAWT